MSNLHIPHCDNHIALTSTIIVLPVDANSTLEIHVIDISTLASNKTVNLPVTPVTALDPKVTLADTHDATVTIAADNLAAA